jgi:hypothetical protein
MARHSFWMEQVALSALVVFLLSIHPVQSQQPRTTTITYACRATNLESVMEFLSRTSGYHFIYSRDLIDITRPVSLNVSNKPIETVLALIEKQVKVVFKVQERHIIVKPIPKTGASEETVVALPAVVKTNADLPAKSPIASPLLSSLSRTVPTRPIVSNRSTLESRLDRRIRELHATLGPNVPRNIPPMYVNRINFNNRNRGWFASLGAVVSDHATAVEVQGGLRYLYGVVQPRWSPERGLYGAYGVGNSFTLMRNFSFNTIYMFSGSKQSATVYPFNPLGKTGPEFQVTQTTVHHQVKLAVQYAVSPTVSVRLGPVLNYKIFATEVVPLRGNYYGYYEGTFIYRQPDTPDIVYQNGQFDTQSVRRNESWLGWEGAVSYRINFSNRR